MRETLRRDRRARRRRVLIDEVYLDAGRRAERAPARRRLRHHVEPDQGLRPLRPALRLDPRRARRSPSGCGGSTNCSASPRPMPTSGCRCIALERLDEIAAETPALLARNRALANAFFAGRGDLEVAPMVAQRHLPSRACCAATSTRSTPCCARATTPRSCPAASSASPTISGSASAGRPRWSRPGWSGSARALDELA